MVCDKFEYRCPQALIRATPLPLTGSFPMIEPWPIIRILSLLYAPPPRGGRSHAALASGFGAGCRRHDFCLLLVPPPITIRQICEVKAHTEASAYRNQYTSIWRSSRESSLERWTWRPYWTIPRDELVDSRNTALGTQAGLLTSQSIWIRPRGATQISRHGTPAKHQPRS